MTSTSNDATHEALRRGRALHPEIELSAGQLAGYLADRKLEQIAGDGMDPELALMKESYRAAFKRGFASAVDELESRQRNLLRLHLLGGVTLDKLAELYGVHRATVVRWLARARERVLDRTRAHMTESLGLSGGELNSVMGLIGSRLDASVQRLLASTAD